MTKDALASTGARCDATTAAGRRGQRENGDATCSAGASITLDYFGTRKDLCRIHEAALRRAEGEGEAMVDNLLKLWEWK